ncbi:MULTISPECIES: FAD synthetase family protein [Listeria]|uniref:FAD synthetase family protein n=1 Tax=Listeria TaxID=1637 RepID=UPI000B58AACF|nr:MULTISPECIES: FAD synthetase family protein [Listeria]
MEIYHVKMGSVPDKRKAVLSIGKFDGIHLGHQKILEAAHQVKQAGEQLSVISFSPHPLWALKKLPEYREAITPRTEKERWLAHYGVDVLFETDFTPKYAETTPEVFVSEHLTTLHLSHIIVGEEFNFGKGRASDVDLLTELCKPFNIRVTAVSVKKYGKNKVSSTDIRAMIRRAEFREAEKWLGHPWYVSGEVQDGIMTGLDDYCLPTAASYKTNHGPVQMTKNHQIKVDLPDGAHTLRFIAPF